MHLEVLKLQTIAGQSITACTVLQLVNVLAWFLLNYSDQRRKTR